MKNVYLVTVVLFSLLGCETAKLHDTYKYNNDMSKASIDKTLSENKFDKVLVLDRPPQKIEIIRPDDRPQWFSQTSKVNADNLPLSLALRQIIGDQVPIKYGHAVDPAKPATIFFEGTKEEALNVLALNVNYGITANKTEIKVDKFITKTYSIPTTSGEESFQMGSSNSGSAVTSSQASEGEISSTGSGDGQFAQSVIEKYNVTEQIYQGVNKLLSGESDLKSGDSTEKQVLGYAEAIKGSSAIVVRTTPSMMKLVDEYIGAMVDDLTRQVELEVTVIEYQHDDSSELGINANLSNVASNGIFNLNVSAPTLSGSIDKLGLGFEATGGIWNGSTAIINALRQTGAVSVNTQQLITASNHKVQEIDLSTLRSYTLSAKTTFEGADNSIPVTTLDRPIARDGVKLFALANIQDEQVFLKLNGVLSKIVKFETETVNNIKLESPVTRQARFNTTGAFNYNETIIVTHMRQETNESNETKHADIPTGNSARNKVVDTLVLVTPRKKWR